MASSSEESLPSKIQKYLNGEIQKDMETICGLLRSELHYGRNVLERIGSSPLRLYDEMSKKGEFRGGDYSKLLAILTKAECGEAVEGLNNIINTHGLPAYTERPQNLALSKKRSLAEENSAAQTKRRLYSVNSADSSQGSFVSPDGIPAMMPGLKMYPGYGDRQYELPEDCYGLVAIINNFTEEGSKLYRKGTNEDEKRIIDLFKKTEPFKSRYRVEKTKKNLTLEGFRRALKNWQWILEENEDSIHSFFLFIMSHGDEKGIKTYYDSNTPPSEVEKCFISIEEITDAFKSCLKDRPKVIVIQACQGESDNSAEDVHSDYDSIQQVTEITDEENAEECESDFPPVPVAPPDAADMLTAFATVKGYRSYRSTNKGSWFIKEFIRELTRSYVEQSFYTPHILDILTEVQYLVANRKGRSTSSDSAKENQKVLVRQMPCFQSSLRKKFYLLPPRLP